MYIIGYGQMHYFVYILHFLTYSCMYPCVSLRPIRYAFYIGVISIFLSSWTFLICFSHCSGQFPGKGLGMFRKMAIIVRVYVVYHFYSRPVLESSRQLDSGALCFICPPSNGGYGKKKLYPVRKNCSVCTMPQTSAATWDKLIRALVCLLLSLG